MRMLRWMMLCVLCPALVVSTGAQDDTSNLAVNPSFEEPQGGIGQAPKDWSVFTSKMNTMGITDKIARTGEQSLKMSAQKVPDAYQGINVFMDVAEGDRYSFSIFMISDREDKIGGTAHGMLVIEWKRADGSEISRALSRNWMAQNVSRLRWEQLQLSKVTVPKDAVKAAFGIHICEGKQGGKGTIYVDDVRIERN